MCTAHRPGRVVVDGTPGGNIRNNVPKATETLDAIVRATAPVWEAVAYATLPAGHPELHDGVHADQPGDDAGAARHHRWDAVHRSVLTP